MRVRSGAAAPGGARKQPFRAERPSRAAAPDVAGAREPLVDSFDEGDDIVVTAELPGVRTDEIDLTIDGEDLVIRTTGQRRYHARQPLGGPVLAGSLSPELRNGILSVRIRKTPA
jgi:HSP20 family protein